MENPSLQERLSDLFENWAGIRPVTIHRIPAAGSGRSYFRLSNGEHSAIGTYNEDKRENQAFLSFAKHFGQKGIAVPKIYQVDQAGDLYLQQDLGDESLFDLLQQSRSPQDPFPDSIRSLYAQALKELARLQVQGRDGLNTDLCYPRKHFDRQSIQWDLNYFKYYFLKLSSQTFDEQLLEDDFDRIIHQLLEADADYFMFRDFQARNIMVKDGKTWFIDFQGGRLGALPYDVVSLLWQARANLPHSDREELLEYYLEEVSRHISIDKASFRAAYYKFVYVRVLQVLGAYGYRGIIEQKPHFIKSIPFALANLSWLLEHQPLEEELAYLQQVLQKLIQDSKWEDIAPRPVPQAPLVVHIRSFSYKNGYPEDQFGHGGGFVFDCRGIHNPGRYEPYKKLTGRDEPVKQFLMEKSHMPEFLRHVYGAVGKSVQVYLDRGFDHLSVNFGCTGGQHRSVYAADALASYLASTYEVQTEVIHLVQEKKGWINE